MEQLSWQEKIIAAHLQVTDQVSHSARMQSDRYFVWQEQDRQDLEADDIHAERAVIGTTDLFTKREFDPWADEIEAAFDAAGILWYLESVQYEQDTGFAHYEWYWTVV